MFGVTHEDRQMRMMGQNTNTMSGMPGLHMLNNFSSGTTQRMHQTVLNQKLPIISTRKAHFAIDQRVWDAEYSEAAKINHSYPADL